MSRVLPHSQEAEESVIGAALLHQRAFVDISFLAPDDFYHPALRAVYEAMVELDRASKPIDVLTLEQQMRTSETFERLRAFNGADYLVELQAKVITVENVAFHANIVRRKAERRRRTAAYMEMAAKGFGDSDDEVFIAESDRLMLELSTMAAARGPKSMKQMLRTVVNELGERHRQHQAGVKVHGVPTGIDRLDRKLGGLRPGKLYVIAGRPATGKSALAGCIELTAARAGHPCLDYSLEMTGEERAERLLSNSGDVSGDALLSGDLSIAEWRRLQRGAADMAELPIWSDDEAPQTVVDIRARARRWRLRHCKPTQKPIVLVDFLQLVAAEKRKGASREQEVSEVSRGLKTLAREQEIPVVAVASLNRGVEQRDDKRPRMSDLRESGAIESDADVVLLLYRDEIYNPDTKDNGIAEIIIGKHRGGPTGMVKAAWLPQFSRFGNLAESSYDDAPPPQHWSDK